MKRRAIVIGLVTAALAPLLVGQVASAATLGSCNGSAMVRTTPPPGSAGGSCTATFSLATAKTVTMTLSPGVDFVGTLDMQATNISANKAFFLSGAFVAQQPVQGAASMTAAFPAGSWKITVTAGRVIQQLAGTCTPNISGLNPVCVPGAALGGFAGSVTG